MQHHFPKPYMCRKCAASTFYSWKSKAGYYLRRCNVCLKKYYSENSEKFKDYNKKNIEKINKGKIEWRKKNPDKVRAIQSRASSKRIKAMDDSYIRGTLNFGGLLNFKSIPRELVEMKRLQIALFRKAKELKGG